uniref:Cytochrome P450 n=1 Tax=Leersia perrieri TaxID=77586 RepID=A0A0D9WGJ5_9ORYZ
MISSFKEKPYLPLYSPGGTRWVRFEKSDGRRRPVPLHPAAEPQRPADGSRRGRQCPARAQQESASALRSTGEQRAAAQGAAWQRRRVWPPARVSVRGAAPRGSQAAFRQDGSWHSRCLLGKEVMGTMFNEVCTQFREIENGVNMMSVFFPHSAIIPANRRRNRARERLHAMFSDIVRSRKQQQQQGRDHQVDRDVLQSLIDLQEAEVSGLIICMLFAAKHTSTYTSIWMGARLLSHGNFLADAVAEQDRVVRKHGSDANGRITDHFGFLMDMPTLHNCVKETLRLHPPVPVLVRAAHKPFTVRTREGREYVVPGGNTLANPIVVSNSVPYIYKDAHLYDPDRFGPGREEDKVGGKFSYASFGGGRTSCVGEGYAYMQIKLIWSHLLRNFELKLLSPFPESYWSKLVLEPQGKLMVSYKRRRLLPTT